MVQKCCVKDCESTQCHRGISLHPFPLTHDSDLKKWIDFVNNSNGFQGFEPVSHSRICSLHFLDSDYYMSNGKRRLNRGAIPSVDLNSDDENDIFVGDITRSEKTYERIDSGATNQPSTSHSSDNDQLRNKIAELEHQNSLLTKELMDERKNYVEAKVEFESKISVLEDMNSELITRDFEVVQLEEKVAEMTKLLEKSNENESLLRIKLIGKSILEDHLTSEVAGLKSKLEELESKNENEKSSLISLETNLVKIKKRNVWLSGSSKGRITAFITKDDFTGQKWTGLSKLARQGLYDFLGPAKDELQMYKRDCKSGDLRSMSVEDQFLLCLLILRKDWSYQDVGSVFGIDDQIVSSTFVTWLNFIYHKYKDDEAFFFTKKKDIKKDSLPECFQSKELRETRCVIDCTEFKVQSSR